MSHIPEGHQGTSIHHISVVKGSTQGKIFLCLSCCINGNCLSLFFSVGAYRCEILNREFMFSDQLATVISGLYGHDIAEVLSFINLLSFIYINDIFNSIRIIMLIKNVLIVSHY
jgi:hypothetical protein